MEDRHKEKWAYKKKGGAVRKERGKDTNQDWEDPGKLSGVKQKE